MSTTLDDFGYPSPEIFECPYPFFKALHDESPVYRVPGTDDFLVTRYDDVVFVTRNPDLFSNRRDGWSAKYSHVPEVAEILSEGCPFVPTTAYSDPPEHGRYRSVSHQALSPPRVREAAPKIERTVHELIDAFIDKGECDIVHDFADLLPSLVVFHLLGIDPQPGDDYRLWTIRYAELAASMLPHDQAVEAARAVTSFQQALMREIESRRANPRDDVLSEMVNAVKDTGEQYTVPELVNLTLTIIEGGNSTTAHTLANGMLLLLQHPDQMQAVLDDHSIIPQAVEEVMRYETPAQFLQRRATTDVEVNGVLIPKGARVLVYFAAANRDAEHFEDPDRFDIFREGLGTHVAFGHGAHRCLGAPLARLELKTAFEAFFTRLRNIRLKPGANDLAYMRHPMFRGPLHLWIEFDRA